METKAGFEFSSSSSTSTLLALVLCLFSLFTYSKFLQFNVIFACALLKGNEGIYISALDCNVILDALKLAQWDFIGVFVSMKQALF